MTSQLRIDMEVLILATDTDKARKTIGFCPQHNILISELTVDEHFTFFAQACFQSITHSDQLISVSSIDHQFDGNRDKLKGFSLQQAKDELEKLVYEVQLGRRSTKFSHLMPAP